MTWVLIVIGVYGGGFGFSQEFTTYTLCDKAKNQIEVALKKAPAFAYCVQK